MFEETRINPNSLNPDPRTCDSRSNQNQTYFTNPGYPSSYNGTLHCSLEIHKIFTPLRICQIRLDFIDFELNRPTEGDCVQDRFVVSGQNANSVSPALCGRNTGQHSEYQSIVCGIKLFPSTKIPVYFDMDGAQGPFTLRVMTSGPGYRRWNIRVSQIECGSLSRAPANCLQYFTGASGVFQSFNYESIRPLSETLLTPQTMYLPRESSYFNNMDYTICFRKEVGFCTQTYQVNTTLVPMEITESPPVPNAQSPFDLRTYGGAGVQRCPYDYLLLDGVRYCGARLNPNAVQNYLDVDAPVIDRGSGPFTARFVSNERHVGRGFLIGFQQNPCGSRLPIEQYVPASG